jgi:8-hydroxy-5-deazaflavin:NADPH oxidoreductase
MSQPVIPRVRSALLAVTAAATIAAGAAPLEGQLPATSRYTIGVIGAGSMGGPLGRAWAEAGHKVVWGTRNPEELVELVQSAAPNAAAGFADAAAAFGDVIVLAVPPSAIPQLGRDYGHLMEGKIVIDITNPRLDRDGEITNEWLEMGTGLAMAEYLPGARVVKAFNTLSARMLADPAPNGTRIGIPIASDDEEAIRVAALLVREAGFEPVVVGPLARAKEFDRGTPVWVTGMSAAEVREALGLSEGR